jgi:hypothetical protein
MLSTEIDHTMHDFGATTFDQDVDFYFIRG